MVECVAHNNKVAGSNPARLIERFDKFTNIINK